MYSIVYCLFLRCCCCSFFLFINILLLSFASIQWIVLYLLFFICTSIVLYVVFYFIFLLQRNIQTAECRCAKAKTVSTYNIEYRLRLILRPKIWNGPNIGPHPSDLVRDLVRSKCLASKLVASGIQCSMLISSSHFTPSYCPSIL